MDEGDSVGNFELCSWCTGWGIRIREITFHRKACLFMSGFHFFAPTHFGSYTLDLPLLSIHNIFNAKIADKTSTLMNHTRSSSKNLEGL